MLKIAHLTKTFGEKKAVDDLSLEIAPGEIYGFIGHNGAGKTTTLKSVVGIQQFDAGEITIGGISLKKDPLACKRQLAYIPDNPDLYDFMTGIKYLNFIADIFGVSASDRQARIQKYADLFELTDDLAQPIAAYSHGIHVKSAAYPLYLFGRYAEGDWTAIAVFTLATAALFALLWYVLSRSFLGIVTATGKAVRRAYREKAVQRQSISRALFGKELGRFTASANYMLNCGLGTLLLPVGGIALLVKGSMAAELLDELLARPGCTSLLLCTGICMVAAMNDMAAPSVSLEGRNLWLAQSLPILPWQALRAKLSVQLLLTGIPALFCCVCVQFLCPVSPVERVLLVLVPMLYVLFSALFGLFLGVKLPNLTWTNELAPIKQSASVMIALLGGWAYGVALAGLYLAFAWRLGLTLYLALFALVTAVGCVVLYRWLKTRGAELFASL